MNLFPLWSQQRWTLCLRLHDILLLKGTKHQLSVCDNMQILYRFSMSVFHFNSVSGPLEKDGLKNKINRMHKLAHTNKYRLNFEVTTFPWLTHMQNVRIRWLGHKTNWLLWHCLTKQEGHATELRPQENDTGQPLGTWQPYCGGTNATYVFWRTSMTHQQRVISAIITGRS